MSTILHGPVLRVPAEDPARAVKFMLRWAPWWAQWYWSEGGAVLLARCPPGGGPHDVLIETGPKRVGNPVLEKSLAGVLSSHPRYDGSCRR